MWWIEQSVVLAMTTAVCGGIRWPLAARVTGGRWLGQSTVEYALVGALVVIAAAGAMTILGGQLTAVFTNISNTLRTAATGH